MLLVVSVIGENQLLIPEDSDIKSQLIDNLLIIPELESENSHFLYQDQQVDAKNEFPLIKTSTYLGGSGGDTIEDIHIDTQGILSIH
jgi:hypothetical protein